MLGRRTDERRQEGQSELGVPGPMFPSGDCEAAHGCTVPPQPGQSLTTFIISGKLRSGILMSMVEALGFQAASWSLTKVSGVKHPAPERAQSLGEPWAGRWGLCFNPGPSGHSWWTLGKSLLLSGPQFLICKWESATVLACSQHTSSFFHPTCHSFIHLFFHSVKPDTS